MASKSPRLLTDKQRTLYTSIPESFPDREIARFYTLSIHDLEVIRQHKRPDTQLGFAMQLCVLRFPGRKLTELPGVPERIVDYVADQIGVEASVFKEYSNRRPTLYEHLAKIREVFGYRDYGWPEMLALAQHLLPYAMESGRPIPLIEEALTYLRKHQIIAPGITSIERIVWGVERTARWRMEKRLTRCLSADQRAFLEGLLEVDGDLGGISRLGWLRLAPKKATRSNIYQMIERIDFLLNVNLPDLPEDVPRNRVLQMARRCGRYQAQPLAKLQSERHRYALLVAYLAELSKDLIDQLIELFIIWMHDLRRKGEREQDRQLESHARAMNRHLYTLMHASDALLMAKDKHLNPFETVFGVVQEVDLRQAVTASKSILRPPDLDFRDLIEDRYKPRRRALLTLYRALAFQAAEAKRAPLDALDHVVRLDNVGERATVTEQYIKKEGITLQAPLEHLSRSAWRKHAVLADGAINPNYYEVSAFYKLRSGIRSGDIFVRGSRRYRDFEHYLLSSNEWQKLKAAGQTRLSITGSASDYLIQRQTQIGKLLDAIQAELSDENGSLSIKVEGGMHLEALDSVIPEEALKARDRVHRILPEMELTDVIIEVDRWTGFLDHFRHLVSGQPLLDEGKRVLIAAMMGMGMNLGPQKMAQATDYGYRQLSWTADWHIRDDTLTKAQAQLDNFVLSQPVSEAWGDGTKSSSDGLRVLVGVNTAHASYNPRYFGYKPGVTIVSHVADVWMPFGLPVIVTGGREALYVIDALCDHESDLDIFEHYTDTGGSTYHVFALCSLLGFRFAPNLRKMTEQLLYSVEPISLGEPLETLMRTVDADLIERNWDDTLRLASSIRHGTVSASLIMRKLASYPQQNQIARALREIGRLERTVFILDYFLDEALRRRVRTGLNKGEALQALARALFFGRSGEFRDHHLEDQMHRASCLMMLISSISAWNAVYIDKALAHLRSIGEAVSEEYLSHISPLAWEHINFLGRYSFDLDGAHPLHALRDLRL